MSVLVVLEQRGGKFIPLSYEAVAAGVKSGEPVQALVLGSGLDELAGEAAKLPVEKVLVLDDPALGEYTPDAYVAALDKVVKAIQPTAVIFPHTYQVRDYAPKLATRFECVLLSDVVEVQGNGVYVRQLFQGKLNAKVKASGSPQFVSVQAGAFRAAERTGTPARLEKFSVNLEAAQIRSKPEAPFREAQRSVDLGAADSIVAVGRGIKEQGNLGIVEELASALGADLAASRPICDNGWLPMERQVGSSGQTVHPKVYVAVGISGAIQHLVGMKGSKVVVAINKDENAPIFEIADYGVVGDLFEVVPALVQEIKKVRS